MPLICVSSGLIRGTGNSNGQRLAVDHNTSVQGNTSSAPINDGEELL